MSFWAYCCKFPQVYRPYTKVRQFPGDAVSPGGWKPELDGAARDIDPRSERHESIDNQGDWSVLSDYAGIASDGTLWCWIPYVIYSHSFKRGYDLPFHPNPFYFLIDSVNLSDGMPGMPVKISEDTDWSFVTSNYKRGFAIKEDGTLWAFGGGGPDDSSPHGIGLNSRRQQGYTVSAKLSSPIKSVSLDYDSKEPHLFESRPTYATLKTSIQPYSPPPGEGAEFDWDWTGEVSFPDDSLSSMTRGSYRTKPDAFIVPTDPEGPDKGKKHPVAVTMGSATAVGFGVVASGSGYTFATAVSNSNAIANAVIVDGRITGWNLVSAGEGLPYGVAPSVVSLIGDGTDAKASVNLGFYEVMKIEKTAGGKIWQERPRVEFSANQGEVAATRPDFDFKGAIDAVRVVSGGSGYSHSKQNKIRLNISSHPTNNQQVCSVRLEPGLINRLEGGNGSSYELAKQCDGAVLPLARTMTTNYSVDGVDWGPQYPSLDQDIRHDGSELVCEGSVKDQLTSVSITQILRGYKYPPFILDHYAFKAGSTATQLVFTTNNFYPNEETSVICVLPVLQGPDSGVPWPINDESITASGPNGSLQEYFNVEGRLVSDKKKYAELDPQPTEWNGVGPPNEPGPTLQRYTGRVGTRVSNLLDHSLAHWVPPSSEEVLRIYFEPSDDGEAAAYAEARPVGGDEFKGYATSPTLIKNIAMYEYEPACIAESGFLGVPTQVGTDNWKDVSVDGDCSYGIKSDGGLYWWGVGAACGAAPCAFPSPVGQGVMPSASPYGGGELVKLAGLPLIKPYGFSSTNERMFCSLPNHGVYRCKFENLQGFDEFAEQKEDKCPKWFFNTRGVSSLFAGLGYTSPPAITYHSIREPLVSFTASLLGPTSFTHLSGKYARTADGQWSSVLWPFVGGGVVYGAADSTRDVYSKRETYRDFSPTSVSHLGKNISTSVVRTRVGTASYRSSPFVTNCGSGYSHATAESTVTLWDEGAWGDDQLVFANGVTVITRELTPHLSVGSVSTPLDVTREGNISTTSFGWFYGLHVIANGSLPTVSVSGDGVGGAAKHPPLPMLGSHLFQASYPGFSEAFYTGVGLSDDGKMCVAGPGHITVVEPCVPHCPAAILKGDVNLFLRQIEIMPGDYQYFSTAVMQDSTAWRIQTSAQHGYLNDSRIDKISMERLFSLSASVKDGGSGYGDILTARVTQQPGVAAAKAVFDAKVLAIGLMNRGSGYSSPPNVTLHRGVEDAETPASGVVGTASAVIAGPIGVVKMTAPGSGYNMPPGVRFVGNGWSAEADCVLDGGGVGSVSITSGGRYRTTPVVVFEPVKQIESISITNGGSGFSSNPKVFIGGKGGTGASATARIRATVISINVTNGGSGYTSAPLVKISGATGNGAAAIAGISVANGEVTGVTIESNGDYYEQAPSVSIEGGGGSGATAIAKISGYVSEVTLVDRGSHFVDPPDVVFYEGGGGGEASATCVLYSPGSGASAEALIDGSIIYITHSGSSGLQVEPTVEIHENTNYKLAELTQLLSGGAIGQGEFDAAAKQVRAKAKCRIEGKVTGVNVTAGGSGYKPASTPYVPGSGFGFAPYLSHYGDPKPPLLSDKRIPCWASVSTVNMRNWAGVNSAGVNSAGTLGVNLPTTVSESGSVVAVSLINHLSQSGDFWKKPEITFNDGLSAVPYTQAVLCCSALASSDITPAEVGGLHHIERARWLTGVFADGVRGMSGYYQNMHRRPGLYENYNSSIPDVISPVGRIADWKGVSLEIGALSSALLYRSLWQELPTLTVEAEVGSGATVTDSGGGAIYSPVVSGGSGYPLMSRLVLRGGRPACWTQSKASATATVLNGVVKSVEVSSPGDGYGNDDAPLVFFTGGGGSGATAVATQNSLGQVISIKVTNPGSGYASSPTVVIVDQAHVFERSRHGKDYQKEVLDSRSPSLDNWKVEFCFQTTRWECSADSPRGIFLPYPDSTNIYRAYFVPFFDENAVVEDVDWCVGPMFGYRESSAIPEIAIIEKASASPATFKVVEEKWSKEIASVGCLKRLPSESDDSGPAPSLTISSDKTSLKIGETAVITFTLSGVSTDFSVGDVTVTGGSLSGFAGSGTAYTATFTPTPSFTGQGTVHVAASKFTGTGSTGNTPASLSPRIKIDTERPRVTITSSNTVIHKGGTAKITFTLSEDCTGFTESDVTVSNGVISAFSGGGSLFYATFTPTNEFVGDGTITVGSNAFTDLSGNANSQTSTLVIDVRTSVVGVTVASNKTILGIGQTATITFTLSKPSSTFLASTPRAYGGNLVSFSGSGTSYTATFVPADGLRGGGSVEVSAGSFTDNDGNKNTAGALSPEIRIYTVAPTVAITTESTILNSYHREDWQQAYVVFTLSTESEDFDVGDVTVTGLTLDDFQGSGRNYNARMIPDEDYVGDGEVTVVAEAFSDVAGNKNQESVSLDPVLVVDTVMPTVSISSSAGSLGKGQTAEITFTLSEEIENFSYGQASASGGVLSNFAGSGTSYTATFTPDDEFVGDGTVYVYANSFTDAAGNYNATGDTLTLSINTT